MTLLTRRLQCQALEGGKPCLNEADHEIDVQIRGDGVIDCISFARIVVCEVHAGFEAELRAVEDAQPVYQKNACPRCGQIGVVIPFDGGPPTEILKHTIPDTFDVCTATKKDLP